MKRPFDEKGEELDGVEGPRAGGDVGGSLSGICTRQSAVGLLARERVGKSRRGRAWGRGMEAYGEDEVGGKPGRY